MEQKGVTEYPQYSLPEIALILDGHRLSRYCSADGFVGPTEPALRLLKLRYCRFPNKSQPEASARDHVKIEIASFTHRVMKNSQLQDLRLDNLVDPRQHSLFTDHRQRFEHTKASGGSCGRHSQCMNDAA